MLRAGGVYEVFGLVGVIIERGYGSVLGDDVDLKLDLCEDCVLKLFSPILDKLERLGG